MNRNPQQRAPAPMRAIARAVIGALVFNALSPLSVIAQDKGYVSPQAQQQLQQYAQLNQKIEAAKADKGKSEADRAGEALAQAQDLLRELDGDRAARAGGKPAKLDAAKRADHRARLKDHLSAARAGRAAVRAEFEATGKELKAKNLPAEILARHSEALGRFEQNAAEFDTLSQAWQQDPSDANVQALHGHFERQPGKRKAAPFDPKKLPWGTPKPTTREPAGSKTAWFHNLWGQQAVRTAQATTIGPINFQIAPEPGQSPSEADLAQTPETQRSAAITAKATELGNNPVAIHNWVRNNVEWVPTWGAIQSADDTLQKRRGNAHDIASLEIALLRAGNIPARYQYGTIELDADKAQNWVGGVTVPQAAQQLLGQGGIANRGIAQGGKIAKVQMEHVWVSAFVNWAPARGARQGTQTQHVNPVGPHNAWVQLDPSYKQYSYSAGMDLKTQVPLDANALLTAAQQGATVNASEGWVQNLNQAAIQNQLADYQARLKTYIDAQNPNATVGDVIGRKIIPELSPSLIAGTLPYSVIQQGQQTSAVPPQLQHQFTYRLYASASDRASDTALIRYTDKTSQLVGKRLTLSYIPATQADADLIASYLPKPHADGSPIQPSEFPTSLPGYLIRLKPQITLDGQVVATSTQSLIMGTDLLSTGGFTQLYDATQWDLTGEESNVVGNATAIGISAGGVSAGQLTKLNDRLTATQTQLQAGNVAGLTGERISGDVLTATIWIWFAAADSHNWVSRNQAGMVENPGLSHGLFHAIANPVYSWGVIRKVTFPGVNMDIGNVRTLGWSKQGNSNEWANYNRLRGQYMSALEHAVPERLFNDPGRCNVPGGGINPALPACSQGISAVKAIAIAAAQGQRIYTITPQVYAENPTMIQNQLSAHSVDTRDRIFNYLEAGLEVSIHQAPVSVSGWSGTGFTVVDPQTGAGAYLIEGGANGVWLALIAAFLVVLLVVVAEVLFPPLVAGLFAFAGFSFNILLQTWFELSDGQKMFIDIAEGMFSIALFSIFAIFGSPVAAAIFSVTLLLSVFIVIYDAICFYFNCPGSSKK